MNHYSVLLNLPVKAGECFTYSSADPIAVGERVVVPLGARREIGYVVAEADAIDGARPVIERMDGLPVLTPDVLELTRRLARRYAAPWYRCVELALPASFKRTGRRTERIRRVLAAILDPTAAEREFGGDERLLSAYLTLIAHPDTFTVTELGARFELGRARLDRWVRKGWATVREIRVRRDPFAGGPAVDSAGTVELNAEQATALDEIALRLDGKSQGGGEVLLVGVTGSGKTEVYLGAITRALEKGKSAILLVPEISLTPQTVDRIRGRLGEGVAILHSQLGAGERQDEWTRIRDGRARVVVGARSAIFAPVTALGLVIVDEAHETSYKQGDVPRYNAIEAARMRAAITGAVLVLGTATPTLELTAPSPKIVRLGSRFGGNPLPEVRIIDMRDELLAGNRSIFSRALANALAQTLRRGEQAILFLNRRGHASFVLCRACGEAIRCPRCDLSLTSHGNRVSSGERGTPMLVCHMCNHRRPQPSTCPKCGSRAIRAFGAGTERIEHEARVRFAEARVVRMDADTTARKGSHRRILEAFAAEKFNVLVGTQMIGKGLDLPRVTLVGVIAADSSLHLPDFRAAERTFNILVQVAGRAGRPASGRVGKAIIQTYAPEHYAIRCAANHDVDAFLADERRQRSLASMPPFTRMIQWAFESESDDAARFGAERAAEELGSLPGALHGPAPAPIPRVRGRSRWLLRWTFDPALDEPTVWEKAHVPLGQRGRDLRVIVDVDPFDLL